MPETLDHARSLRLNMTFSERLLRDALKARRLGGFKWRRQTPRGPYIVDFLCAECGLVLELDGPQHADQLAYDARRTRYLEGLGFRVVRFDSNLVQHDREALCETILRLCREPRS